MLNIYSYVDELLKKSCAISTKIIRNTIIVFTFCFVTIPSAQSRDIGIMIVINQAKILDVSDNVGTVIVGNPAIADVTVHDSKKLVIMGKSPGTTNIIILGNDGKILIDNIIHVGSETDSFVTVYRAMSRYSFSCVGECTPAVRIGDQIDFYRGMTEQTGTYNDQGNVAATAK